jgi:hypothetical protein
MERFLATAAVYPWYSFADNWMCIVWLECRQRNRNVSIRLRAKASRLGFILLY